MGISSYIVLSRGDNSYENFCFCQGIIGYPGTESKQVFLFNVKDFIKDCLT